MYSLNAEIDDFTCFVSRSLMTAKVHFDQNLKFVFQEFWPSSDKICSLYEQSYESEAFWQQNET